MSGARNSLSCDRRNSKDSKSSSGAAKSAGRGKREVSAYYNEHEPYAAQWLENLARDGHIMPGRIDRRDIQQVESGDLDGFTRCHFFAGIAGWDYALKLAGWPTDRPVWTASLPCQPFSEAGKRQGESDDRHLWPVFYRLVCERKPPTIFGEQVEAGVRRGWLDRVFNDLEAKDYACGAVLLPAASVGALHCRQRIWWVAHANSVRSQRVRPAPKEPWTWEQLERLVQAETRVSVPAGKDRALVDGVRGRMGQLRAYGNAIVPQAAAEFVKAFLEVEP